MAEKLPVGAFCPRKLAYSKCKTSHFVTKMQNNRDFYVEPVFVNYILYLSGYEEKEKGQTLNSEDLSSVAPELGLEPRTL